MGPPERKREMFCGLQEVLRRTMSWRLPDHSRLDQVLRPLLLNPNPEE